MSKTIVKETPVDSPWKTFMFAAGAMVFFSMMNVFVKISAMDYSTAQIIFFRNALAFFPILYLISKNGGFGLLKTDNHLGHFWRGAVGIMGMCCFFISFDLLPLSNATAIHFAGPLILTLLSVPLLGEKVGMPRWCAVVIGLGAVFFMMNPQDIGEHMVGSVVAFMAAFFAAFAMIFVRKLGRSEHAMTIVFYFTLYGMLLGGLAMIFMWEPLQKETFFFLVMTGFMGGVGQVMLTYAYAHAPAAYVAPFSYLQIVLAIGADIVIWNTFPDWHIYIGSTVIIASGLFIVYREHTKNKRIAARSASYGLEPTGPTRCDKEQGSK
ncbi:MAG TPA: DMT family transporter [Micavibrio sp.]|nr:DMT family transporter [Micavibrio sp.]